MNKVFKVIWSEARNAYVVVSEMAKSHGTKSCSTKKLLAMLIATGVMTCASVAPAMAANKISPKMIGYEQKWDTDVQKGILGTSINGYQYQGNSLQLNMLKFEKYTTAKGENALAIRVGAYVDGVNESGNIYFVDKNTKNQELTTTIDGSVIKTVLTDTDNNKVESSVDIGSYVGQEVKKAKTEVKAGENVTSVVKETGANGQDIYTTNAKDTTYAAGNGIVINGENNAISVKLKEGESNLQVTDAGLELKKDLTVNSVNAGDYFFDAERGVGFGGEAYVTQSGLNANNKVITNVAAGVADTDAVNVGQLKKSETTINNRIDGVENQVINNTNRINKLGSRVNKVGAGAAALAALHPMDFDPDDKLTFAAGYGNYAGENAAAIGAYYRPDEKVMFSVAGTVGNGENMVNAGISFALDRTNHVSNSRTALAREVIDLRGQLAVMGAKMAKMEKAFGMLDETKTKLFPDIPANHWAYEYIAKLAGNGYIEGYPDGNFGGDRLMTRYEFAAMLYRAIENGAALEEKIIKEFEPELGRIRVDRISGEDGDRDKIERVRVNDTKGERDHYGNKLAK